MPSDVERRALADADRVRITDEAIQALRLLSSTASRVNRKAARADLERAIDRLAVAAYAEGHAAALAALRNPVPAPERDDAGAEAMRERCAREAERQQDLAERCAVKAGEGSIANGRFDLARVVLRDLAVCIRALPLTAPQQDRVQGEESGV